MMREFNYDYVHGKVLPNFNIQVWKYDYSGNSQEIGTAEDFRVNSSQTMMAAVSFLTTSTMPSLEVYDLSNDNIVFSLSLSQIPEQESNTIVNFDLENGGWSHDGRYLWFDSNDEADTLGFLRIDTSNWSYQVFSAPHTTMGGDALNPDVGMTTYETNVAPWTADSQIDQEYRDQAQQAGQITSFYIYNLLTGQNYLVTTTTDPTYYYHPLWLSDSELQYTLPSGATSTYTIP
ncbi:MAG TPA: hypothetical protein VMA75_04585 [Candidatus Paceibacterota bacterium]|nr:hypothetical protein [Candidatus Paceibacterota bacterium]